MKSIRVLNFKNISSCVCAFLGVLGFFYCFNVPGNIYIKIFIAVFLIIISFLLYQKVFERKQALNYWIFTVGFTVLLSGFLLVGSQLDANSWPDLQLEILMIGFYSLLLFPIIALLTGWLDCLQSGAICPTSRTKSFSLKCMMIILITWLLGYLAMFPGVYGIDAPTWYQMWEEGSVSSQWSVLISGIFYLCISLGLKTFYNANFGFAIYTFCQMSFVLIIIWRILIFIDKELGNIATILATLFFIIPTHVILAVSSAQDAAFAGCFAMCCLELVRIYRNPTNYWNQIKNKIRFMVWLILLCMIRNNGLYAIGVLLILVFVWGKNSCVHIFKMLIPVIMVILIYQGPVYNQFHIEKGTAVREMLSVPLQQMARAYNYNTNLSKVQREQMQEFVADENWRKYVSGISDPIKNSFDTERLKNAPMSFFKLYFDVAKNAPFEYASAILLQTHGLWDPNKHYPDPDIWHPYINYICIDAQQIWGEGALNIERTSLFSQYDKVLGSLFGSGKERSGYGGSLTNNFVKIPIFSQVCHIGTYFCLLLYIAGYGLYQRWKTRYLPICFAMGLTLTVFLSPLMCYRYYAPIVFSMPLLLTTLFLQENTYIKKEN